jgi:hypothetical protein
MWVDVGLIIDACVKQIVPVWTEFNSLMISGWAFEHGNEPLVHEMLNYYQLLKNTLHRGVN